MTTLLGLPKRLLVGHPMRSNQLGETLLPKKVALAVYCSDAISSNAYATQEILLVLALGGAMAVTLTPWVALAVVVLLALVALSYQQTCAAYPSGGGAYAVSRENLGKVPSLVAASALMVDYVMTVAVSVASGVDNLSSAFPVIRPWSVTIALVTVAVIAVMNLRGVRESGVAFAIPTYGFMVSVFVMLGVGFYHTATGHRPVSESASFGIASPSVAGAALLLLVLRAFASGCTALTGVEAVSNGVPTFKPPQPKNAQITLALMAGLAITMMMGIAVLSSVAKIHIADDTSILVGAPEGYVPSTVLAQLAAAIFGAQSIGLYVVSIFTMLILALAANTAFNGFPILASLLAQDRYLPKQLRRRGDRLVHSNGIIILAAIAGGLIWYFDGSVTRLIQLYILGVFISFTLSQMGMVVHWVRQARSTRWTGRHLWALAVNALGGIATALVLVIVLITKFTHGAWLVVVAIPVIVYWMLGVKRHYSVVSKRLRPRASGVTLPSRIHAVVLVSRVNEPALRALALARAMNASTLTALRVDTARESTEQVIEDWETRDIPVPLTIVASHYRDLTSPVIAHLLRMSIGPRDIVNVFIPEYVVGHWWEQLLHNQSALRLKARLLLMPGVVVTSVPFQLASAEPYQLERAGVDANQVLPDKPVARVPEAGANSSAHEPDLSPADRVAEPAAPGPQAPSGASGSQSAAQAERVRAGAPVRPPAGVAG